MTHPPQNPKAAFDRTLRRFVIAFAVVEAAILGYAVYATLNR